MARCSVIFISASSPPMAIGGSAQLQSAKRLARLPRQSSIRGPGGDLLEQFLRLGRPDAFQNFKSAIETNRISGLLSLSNPLEESFDTLPKIEFRFPVEDVAQDRNRLFGALFELCLGLASNRELLRGEVFRQLA